MSFSDNWQPNPQELQQVLNLLRHSQSTENAIKLQVQQSVDQLNTHSEFSCYLVYILGNLKDQQVADRALSGIMLKNTIRQNWLQIPAQIQFYIKHNCLLAIADDSPLIRATVGIIITNIFTHDGSANWPELLPSLCQMLSSTNANIVEGALGAIKNICEDSADHLSQEEVNNMVAKLLGFLTSSVPKFRSLSVNTVNSILMSQKWKSKKSAKTAEDPIVVLMFRDEPMKQILTAASLAADSSATSEEQYNYLKALCDLVCALGVHLVEVWSLINNLPNFSIYLSALSAFFVHPSIYIRSEAAQILTSFSAHERISKTEDFLNCITALFQLLPKALEKVGAPSTNNSLTSHYSRMDYDSDEEFQHDYLQLRDRCLRMVRECTPAHHDKLIAIVREWVVSRCIAQPEAVMSDEWDILKRFITTVLSTSYQLDIATTENRKDYFLSLFDSVLERICVIPTKSGDQDARVINELLSILSAFFQVFIDAPDRIGLVLTQLKTLFLIDNDKNENPEVTSLKRHCIALLLKMVSSYPEVIKPYAHTVFDLVSEVVDKVSLMQRASLVHVLGALSNLATNQEAFLRNSTSYIISFLEQEQLSASPIAFLNSSGLTQPPPANEQELQQSIAYQNRLNLKAQLTAVEGVLQQVNPPKDGFLSHPFFAILYPVIPKFFQLIRCLNAIHRPENAALIHPTYGRAVLEMSAREKQCIFASMMDIASRASTTDADLMDSSGTSKFGSNSSTDSLTFLRRFVTEITDIIQNIVGMLGARCSRDLYTFPGAAEMFSSSLESVELLPNFRLRFWIRKTWSRLIANCPAERSASVLPLTTALTRHLQQLIGDQWVVIQNRNEDTEPTEEELMTENMMSILSRDTANMFSAIILGDTTVPKGTSRKGLTQSITPLAKELLQEQELLHNTLALLTKLINCPDSQAALRTVPVLGAIVANFYLRFDEQMALYLLVQAIKSLQTHGSDEVAAGPLLSLIFSIYSLLRPIYPSMVDILKQVPDSILENIEHFDSRVLAMVGNVDTKPNSEKIRRDLMRKILKTVIAQKPGEQHKQTQPRPRTAQRDHQRTDVNGSSQMITNDDYDGVFF